MAVVELRFTPLPAHVRTARLLAATLARRNGLDEALIDEVKLAVGEACARAVGLHQAHADGEPVVITFDDDGSSYAVTVSDQCPSGADTAAEVAGLPDLVDLDALAEPYPDGDGALAMPIGRPLPPGFGLAVVAGLVDDLTVTTNGAGTVVRMSWPRA